MWMYGEKDVIRIVEDFLAKHFNFDGVYLNDESQKELAEICSRYGVYIENIEEQ